jgi:hypothetical protein
LLASDKSSGLCPCGTSRKVFSSFFRMFLPAELAEQRGIHLMELVRNRQQGVFCIIESYCIRNEVLWVGIDLIWSGIVYNLTEYG